MIALFTDFGYAGPYVGQMKAVVAAATPGQTVIDLFHDAPAFGVQPSAYLLASLIAAFPVGTVFVCVVDPGVGSDRRPVLVEADGRRYVGPDNGLFEPVVRRASHAAAWLITWRPETLSASFHGRDLFAPVAAMLARGDSVPADPLDIDAVRRPGWPDDLAEIVYIDRFGNAMTGIRAPSLAPGAAIVAGGRRLERRRTFSDAAPGECFWYENANGLAEIAANQGSAAALLGLEVGSALRVR